MKILGRLFKNGKNSHSSDCTGYYQQAKSWYIERYEINEASLNRYRLVAFILCMLLGLSLISISIMLPLKQYVYRVITLNQVTGEMVNLKEVDPNDYSSNWLVTRFFINQYILDRNLYNHDDYLRTYNNALALSDQLNAEELHNEFIYTNPKSPLNILKNESYRDVVVLSINQLNQNTAIVRFKTTTKSKTENSEAKIEELQAVVKWKYTTPPDDIDYHDVNPLGFYVTYYQVSPVIGESNNE